MMHFWSLIPNTRRFARVAFSALFMWLAAGCARGPVERSWVAMGTFASVTVSGSDAHRIDEAERIVQDKLSLLERLWSNYSEESEISAFNRSHEKPIALSPETFELIVKSTGFSRATEGRFDPTVGPLVDLWGIGKPGEFVVPSDIAVTETLKRCGWGKLKVSKSDNIAVPGAEGMVFDSGGIAKGLAVDMCYEMLKERGFENILINLGGNMRSSGSGRSRQDWRVGVRNPFDRTKMLGILHLTDGMAVATSGNYERFVEKDGKRYAHIIDPLSGRPVEGMAGVTVVAPAAVEADALSTALFVAGVEEGQEILAKFPEVEAIFVEDSLPVVLKVSPGMEQLLEVTDDVTVEVLKSRQARKLL